MDARLSEDPYQRLPLGATGFWDYRDPPLPVTDLKTFQRVCYEAARHLGGKVIEITPHGDISSYGITNYHRATISSTRRRLAVLCHGHLPLLAIAAAPAENTLVVDFIDDPSASAALASQSSFRLLARDELDTPLALTDLSGLSRAELKQIAYRKPYTVGELLFNHWD
jgi:hypothetical protein